MFSMGLSWWYCPYTGQQVRRAEGSDEERDEERKTLRDFLALLKPNSLHYSFFVEHLS